ncbi:MAG: DUF4136 domain-containing protein [Pseudomonadota bacterium]|nr:DUF4136 domain-containing protein [Pseudomonadota bacterium]
MHRLLYAATLALLLGGCAALNNLSSEVATYGAWPADRRPTSFVFERLPSQDIHPERQVQIETAARGALEAVGFRAVALPDEAQYLVQIGARVVGTDPWMYNDPLFLRGRFGWGYGRWGRPGRWGGGWGWGWGPDDYPTFDREVMLVIRDRQTGALLYETHASNSGPSPAIDSLLPAMFAAALTRFPTVDPNPRNVTTPIRPVAPA